MGLTRIRAQQISDIDYKQACRVVSITNITLAGGAPAAVDGVSLQQLDRVLVTGQNTASENGFYFVQTLGQGANGTWARTTDANETGEIAPGMIVMVTEGETYADTQWKLTTNGTVIVGTTDLNFVLNAVSVIGGSNTQIQYNAGGTLAGSANLTFANNELAVIGQANVSGNITANTGNFTALSVQTGVSSNLTPTANVTYDLGSPTNQWRDIYVGPGSLYVNNQKVLEDNSGTIVISADENQNLSILTKGNGEIELTTGTSGTIQVKSNLVINSGYTFSSGSGAVDFSSGIKSDSVTSSSTNTTLSLSGSGTGYVNVADDLVVTGNLTVQGDTVNLSVTALTVQDNIINIVAEQTGAPVANAGIQVIRGDSAGVQLRWDENADKWKFTNDGATYFEILGSGTDISVTGIENTGANGVGNIGSSSTYFNTVFAKATSAQYADLAEMYLADDQYPPGTVMVLGGNSEITQSTMDYQTSVVGTISQNPAHVMNSGLQGNHAVALALVGRVPCRVAGLVCKGDLLVTSKIPGTAQKIDPQRYVPGSVLGKSLENKISEDVSIIEILVGRL